jgi:hypothetical protein
MNCRYDSYSALVAQRQEINAMEKNQALTDKLAIGLSLMCAIHCLAIPMLFLFLPSAAVLPLDNEIFHFWLVAAVIPSSIYALTLGCRQHKRYRLLTMGAIGLSLLVLALMLGEDRIGEIGEKVLTVMGACFIAVGHWLNYGLCRAQEPNAFSCCDEEQVSKP